MKHQKFYRRILYFFLLMFFVYEFLKQYPKIRREHKVRSKMIDMEERILELEAKLAVIEEDLIEAKVRK